MDKKYWWIKLTCDFYRKPAIDFLRRQENGNTYVVIYLILCMETANNNGIMAQQIGEIIAPFTDQDVARLTNENIDVVRKAMELYVKLGLIYERISDGYLQIRDVSEMVGYTTDSAKKMKAWRDKKKAGLISNVITNEITDEITHVTTDVMQENRDKSLDIRDKSIENRERDESLEKDQEKEKDKEKENTNRKRFTCPSIDDVREYAEEKGYTGFDAEAFWYYYDSKGWKVGRNPMKNWKSAVSGWYKRDLESKPYTYQKRNPLDDLPF